MCVLAIGMNLPPVFLTTIRFDYALKGISLSDEDLGRLAACPFIGLVAACCFTGPLADKYGAKIFCLVGNFCSFCGLLLCAFASSVLTLSFALVILGLGSGMLDMVLSPVIGALNTDNRSGSMNFLHSMYVRRLPQCVFVTVWSGTARALFSLLWWFNWASAGRLLALFSPALLY
jgi:MFS family permease